MKNAKNKFSSILVIMMMVLSIVPAAFADTEEGATASEGPGVPAWLAPGNAIGSDDVYTSSALLIGETSNNLYLTNFGFAIPDGVTIDSISVAIKRSREGGIPPVIHDSSVRLMKAGAVIGDDAATATPWPSLTLSGDATEDHMPVDPLWGSTWTPAEINAAGFGVAMSATREVGGTVATRRAFIDNVQITVDYTDIEAPVASFTAIPNPVDEGSSVTFSSTSTDNVGITRYDWNFGDGTILLDDLASPAPHPYADGADSHTVTLTVYDAAGFIVDSTTDIVVNNVAPVAVPGGPYAGVEVVDVSFSAAALDVPADTHTYEWTFSDGGSASGASVTHAFADDGLYTATLVATDDDGGVSLPVDATVTISNANPIASATVSPSSPDTDDDLTCSASATDVPADTVSGPTYQWNDDGVPMVGETSSTLSSTLTTKGHTYTCEATFTDEDGGSDMDPDSVTVVNSNVIVSVTAPVDGDDEHHNGDLLVTWSATDADGDSMIFDVVADGITFCDNTPSLSCTVDTTLLPQGTNTVVVTADDGSATGGSDSAEFTADNVAPVITVSAAQTIEAGDVYVAPIPTAVDDIDGDITINIAVGGEIVDNDTPDVYVITYDVSDDAGNAATQVTHTVTVVDTTAPSITAPAGITMEATGALTPVTLGSPIVTDNSDLAPIVTNDAPPAGYPVGLTTVTWTATDVTAPNAFATSPQAVTITDTTAPIISLTGSDPQIVAQGSGAYVDPGAVASDLVDGLFAATSSGVVDTDTIGDYFVAYDATDVAGNSASTVTRTVQVRDLTPPTLVSAITRDTNANGQIDTIELEFSEAIDDDRLTVGTSDGWDIEDYGGEAIASGTGINDEFLVLTFTESVTPDTSETPAISYDDTFDVESSTHDLALGSNELETFGPSDETEFYPDDGAAPLIAVTGANPMGLTVGGTYTEEGATLSDAVDVDEAGVVISGTVDTGSAGAYIVSYDASDDAGNTVHAERTVNVASLGGSSSTGGGGGGGGGGGSTAQIRTTTTTSTDQSELTGADEEASPPLNNGASEVDGSSGEITQETGDGDAGNQITGAVVGGGGLGNWWWLIALLIAIGAALGFTWYRRNQA
ncbi:MAG: immunoglobulin-like domain-containing protein [Nanoarchaeota archaeon]